MPRTAQAILDDALKLPAKERKWVAEQLITGANEEAFSTLKLEYGEPEPGYDEWFRAGVEEALADKSPGVPHEEAMRELNQIVRRAKENRIRATILP